MNVADWLKKSTAELTRAKIQTARLDCLVLLEDCTSKDRSWLLANPNFEIPKEQNIKLDSQLRRRINHEPLAYIRNKAEFYGRQFYVDERVLQPRPESEGIIKFLLELKIDSRQTIIDIGTGSGALAITAKLETTADKVIATDIDLNSLIVARQNANALGAKVEFLSGSLLSPLNNIFLKDYVLLCNLPYVPNNLKLNKAATKEPAIAIFGGKDGLDLYIELFEQISRLKTKPLYVITESLPEQHKRLAEIAQTSGYEKLRADGFVQSFKKI
jgi:release factor glutamine methyltransferase